MTASTGAGRLYVGTSGFAYSSWVGPFYPPGTRGSELLRAYASRLSACELNNTYYRQPSAERVAAWVEATPATFRFAVKALRTGSWVAYAKDPADALPWLTAPLSAFGERLGTALFRVPDQAERDETRLARLLAAWPRSLPLAVEMRRPSWHVDEVYELLSAHGAALCVTDEDGAEVPTVRLTGAFLYLRLRRDDYARDELDAWAARLLPFLRDGRDAFVFFKHDERGRAPALALELLERVSA